jgi:hypothetical protein
MFVATTQAIQPIPVNMPKNMSTINGVLSSISFPLALRPALARLRADYTDTTHKP